MTQGITLPRVPSRDVTFYAVQEAGTYAARVTAVYVTRGPTFEATARRELRQVTRDESRRLQHDLSVEALRAIYAQVEAHRAVTEPIPND